jgi:hypothetical protein
MPTTKKPHGPSKTKADKTPVRSYRVAKTRLTSRSVAGHYPAQHVQAFRVLAAAQDMDVQELLAEGINLVFERHGVPIRIPVFSGRRKRPGGTDRSP